MTLQGIIHEAAETLRLDAAFAGVAVIEENAGDAKTELEKKIARRAVAVLVGWNGFEPVLQKPDASGDPSCVIGKALVVVSVYEKPAVNRRAAGAPGLLDLAQAAARRLAWARAEAMDAPLFFERITAVDREDSSGVYCVNVEFSTKAEL